jgi:hypothetical protein
MLDDIFASLDRRIAIQAGYLGIRVLKHFASSPRQVVVPGLASEPSPAAIEAVERIVGEIEAVEGVAVSALDRKRRDAYIIRLADIVMKAATRGREIDFAGGIKALEDLRQIGIGRT